MWPLVQTRIQAWPAFTRGLRDLVLLQRFSRTQDPARGKWCGHEAPCDQFGSISNTHTLAHSIRYDFFYTNGVPKWRGTGYYYSRFRPGIGVCARPLPHDPPHTHRFHFTNPQSLEILSRGTTDGLDVPRPSHDGVTIYGSETESCQRPGTNRTDQARRKNNSVGRSIGASGEPKKGKRDLNSMA